MTQQTPAPRRSTRVRKPRIEQRESPEPVTRKRARHASVKSTERKTGKKKKSEDKEKKEGEITTQNSKVQPQVEAEVLKEDGTAVGEEKDGVDSTNLDEVSARKERVWGALSAKDRLKIVTWNVASLRAIEKAGRFRPYLEKERPDLLCLQETKMTPEATEDFEQVEGYRTYWNHSGKKGYSGVAILVSEELEERTGLKVKEMKEGMGLQEADYEARVLTCCFEEFVVVNAYVPNSGGRLARLGFRTEQFEPAMRKYLHELKETYRVIYCGDLNVAHEEIDIHNSKGNQKSAGHTPQERAEFSTFLEQGWKDTFRQLYPTARGFTYYSRRFGDRLRREGKGWRLDYHVVDDNSMHRVADMYVRDQIEGSDHLPVVLEYKL